MNYDTANGIILIALMIIASVAWSSIVLLFLLFIVSLLAWWQWLVIGILTTAAIAIISANQWR